MKRARETTFCHCGSASKSPNLRSPIGHYRSQLNSLNKARVNFKHHGNIPDETTLERHRVNTQNFFNEACLSALGYEFEHVSLSGLIRDEEARGFLDRTDREFQSGEAGNAMNALRLSFEYLLHDYEKRKVSYLGRSVFNTKPSFTPSRWDSTSSTSYLSGSSQLIIEPGCYRLA